MKTIMKKDMTPTLIGETYLRKATDTSPQRYRYGVFKCQYCGKEFEAQLQSIKSRNTISCGCQRAEMLYLHNTQSRTHGLSQNKFFNRWYSMLERCNNPKNISYTNYGGRGIRVCSEWLDPRNFITWCESTHPNVKGVTLDRIDNDKGYSPENCRWADATTQGTNQRKMKNNKSGYVGVIWHIRDKRWVVNIRISKKLINLGSFKDKIEAVLARDNYIIENGLPHKLSILNTGL